MFLKKLYIDNSFSKKKKKNLKVEKRERESEREIIFVIRIVPCAKMSEFTLGDNKNWSK